MRARLGFAAADLPWTDVLLLDEVHEALDHEYREVVEARAQEIVAAGGVVVAAGHDHPLLDRICTRALGSTAAASSRTGRSPSCRSGISRTRTPTARSLRRAR